MLTTSWFYCVLALIITGLSVTIGVQIPEEFQKSNHSNNWAVLVDTSRFWFNYRHVANVLSIYRSVKRLGIPDSQIILMISDDMACNPRNPRPATIFNNAHEQINVSVENFVRLLTGRVPPDTPRSKRLLTDEGSNILIYLTGHGGDGFLKFQDSEEVTTSSMYEKFYSPNILATASSLVGEDSLSLAVCPKSACLSTVGVRRDLFKRDPAKVPITDFFGSVRPVIEQNQIS
ncbi:Phosphatidylinositol glycan [Operophtera brumata]|uniref:Phosphatidylinositol glycan n=1 Tax=Operophtera brumata TaxID=104452 RepID=A0A0L7KXX8_OPEBR|nr:Phosphatidylinositol glycan [Operophtera brumata]